MILQKYDAGFISNLYNLAINKIYYECIISVPIIVHAMELYRQVTIVL